MIEHAVFYSGQQEFPFRNAAFVITFLVFAAIPMFLDLPGWMGAGMVVMGLLTAVFLRSMMVMEASISQSELKFGFWISTKRLPLETIATASVVDIPKLAGIGIHRYGGFWVYNARLGRGLQVETTRGNYMIGSDQPEEFLAALNNARSHRSKQ